MKVLLVCSPGGYLGQLYRLPASAATTAPKSASPHRSVINPLPAAMKMAPGLIPGIEYEMELPGGGQTRVGLRELGR